jgi:hypothetical protein
MNGSLTALYIFSIAAGRPDIAARLNVYALVLVLPATAALIYYFGLSGAGFSWIFFHLFAYSYQVPRTCSECLKVPSRMWFAKILRIAGIVAITYGSAWVLLMATGLDRGLFWPLVAYAVATLGFGGIAYRMVGHELRGSFRGQLFVLTQRAKSAEVL